ncbi:hypothetical protein D3C76_1192820 [compost metagenome]
MDLGEPGPRRLTAFRVLDVDRFILGVPAQAFPDQADCLLHAFGKDLPFRLGHRRRNGEDDRAQVARHPGVTHAQALRGAVDLHQRLAEHLRKHEGHQRAAGIVRVEHRHALFERQTIKRLADLVDQPGHRGRSRMGLGLGFDEGTVEAPARFVGILIPQIALRTGEACRPLGATPTAGQVTGFSADTGDGRPAEGFTAATLDREMILAKDRLGKLDAALERLCIDLFGARQIPQLQLIAFAQAVPFLRMVLDQDAACP